MEWQQSYIMYQSIPAVNIPNGRPPAVRTSFCPAPRGFTYKFVSGALGFRRGQICSWPSFCLAASFKSFNGLLCSYPAGGIRHLQHTQAPWCLDLLPIWMEVGRCLRVFWCDIALAAHQTIT